MPTGRFDRAEATLRGYTLSCPVSLAVRRGAWRRASVLGVKSVFEESAYSTAVQRGWVANACVWPADMPQRCLATDLAAELLADPIRLIVMGSDEWKGAGFGAGDKPESWVTQRDPHSSGTHVAFNCEDRASVLAFHGADFPG